MLLRPALLLASLLMTSIGAHAHWADAIEPTFETFGGDTGSTASVDVSSGLSSGPDLLSAPAHRNWLGERVSVAGDSSEEGGRFRGNLGVAAQDLTGLNDALSLNYRRLVAAREGELNRGLGFDYAFPWRAGTIKLNASLYEYEDSVTSAEHRYDVRGDSQSLNLSANRTLFRHGGTELAAAVGVGARETQRVVEDDIGDASLGRFSSLRFETRLRQTLPLDALAMTSVSAEQGREVFGDENGGHWTETARHDYHKYSIHGSLSKPLGRWYCEVNGRYQFAPEDLPGSQYLRALSPSMIYGLGGQSLAGSQGGWLRLDASSPWQPLQLGPGLSTNLRFSVLRGWVPRRRAEQGSYGGASAAELALQLRGGHFQAGFQVGGLLSASRTAAREPDAPDLSLSFSLQL